MDSSSQICSPLCGRRKRAWMKKNGRYENGGVYTCDSPAWGITAWGIGGTTTLADLPHARAGYSMA